MTRSPDGRCADCVTVGDTPDLAETDRRYCALHGAERERYRKRRNKVVSRARKEGKAAPPPEIYTPLPRAHFGAVYVDNRERWLIQRALLDVRDSEDRVRASMEGADGYAVGLAAEDLIDANHRLRSQVLRALGF